MFVSQIYDECAEILGTTDEKKIFRKIQQAVATLMESGHWTHSVADVDVCTGWDRCSITLPRGIDVPLAVNIDGSPTYFRNRLFQYHVNKGGMFNSVEWAWDDRGYVATLMDIIQPSQLVAVAELENDVGKTIRVLGKDNNNRNLRSQLSNGTGVDGILIPIHSQSDFAYGTIAPDGQTVKTRNVAITPINLFKSVSSHGLSSGQAMAVTDSGTIPVALENGQTYYIGVIDAFTVQLFNDPLNAQALQYPINLQSIIGSGNLQFKDSRESQVVTALELSSAAPFAIDTANPITFPSGQSLPSPLDSKITYFVNAEDSTHLTVFGNADDAQKNINPVYTTGTTASLNVDIRKKIDPQTTLTFSVQHYYKDGDQVQAFTASGTLPQPLIANQNYFVNVINDFTISLHTNAQDAVASTPTNLVNPITLKDSGSGTNSIVKLLPATVTIGTSQQVTAPGLNIDAPSGSGANFEAVVLGSVTSTRIVSQGSEYVSDPDVTFSAPPIPPATSPFYGKTRTATGYATRDTVNNKIISIVITDPGFGYASDPTVTIAGPSQQPVTVNQITSGGGTTATIQTASAQTWNTGDKVIVDGSTVAAYNGTKTITKLTTTTFTFAVAAGQPDDTGTTITATKIAGTQATATASITTSFVSHFNKISGGYGYEQPPQVKISGGSGNGASATATVNSAILNVSGIVTVGTTATATTSFPHGYRVGQSVTISGATPNAYNGTKVITSVPVSTKSVSGIVRSGTIATATTTTAHGYSTGDLVTISGASVAGYNGTFPVTVFSNPNEFTYNVPATLGVTAGTITSSVPDPTGTTFNYAIAGGTASPASGTISVASGDVTSLQLVTSGSGYISTPGVSISPSTGVFISFTSTGTLPSPLVSGTAYRAEIPLNTASGNFTVKNTDFSDINITSSGTGTLYVSLSRSFSVTFTDNWIGDFTGLSTGQQVYFGTDYLLPTTNPAIDNGSTAFYLNVANNSTAKVYNTLVNANAGGTTGLIDVTSFGSGQSYYAIRKSFQSKPYENLIVPSEIEYLTEDEIVRFSTTNTLPSPLLAGTDYTIKLFGNKVKAYLGGVLQTLTTPGSGQLSLDIIRTFTVSPSTSIDADQSQINTGDAVVPRPSENDVLPTGLTSGTTYYVRRIDENSFELYNTKSNAQNLTSTVGRISYTTSGNTVVSRFFIDSVSLPIFVKSVAQVEKPVTEGYVSLYAFDYGRSNDMTLIGQYHPSEVNPQYRRIRIGKPCAWARISYRIQAPTITSAYDFIPLEQERAIVTAVHACDLEDKDFADQAARYWQIAFSYLKNQQESIDGHAMVTPQINSITYGDTTDPVMF